MKVPLLSRSRVDRVDVLLLHFIGKIPNKKNTSEYLEEQRSIADKAIEEKFRKEIRNRSVIVAKTSAL